MAAQTITTAVNYDTAAISGLLDGETITINGGSLTINADVRWNQQAAVLGAVNPSTTLGGSIYVDGTTIWELRFTASTGTVPTQTALGTNGVTGGTSGATGELCRVWATGSLTPSAAGGVMPATGYIKLRTKVGTFQAGEVVTLPGGATITIADAGQRSWIHVVGAETLGFNPVRLGTFSMTGDWYYLGTTNGADDQTFQYPVSDYCPAMQVETAAGSGVYEWWLYGADGVRWGTATQYISTDVRGKYFGCNNTTGVITIARRATNPCGYKPPTGCRVRIPNIILSNSTVGAGWVTNTFSTASLTSRYRITTSNNPNVSIDKIGGTWSFAHFIQANNLTISNLACMMQFSAGSLTGITTLDNIAVGCTPIDFTNNTVLVFVNSTNVTLTNCRVTRIVCAGSGDIACQFATVNNLTLNNCQFELFGASGSVERLTSSSYAFSTSRCGISNITNCTVIGGSFFLNTHVDVVTASNITFADRLVGTTTATQPISAIVVGTCSKAIISGPVNWFGGLASVQPYSPLISINTAANNNIVQNIGSSASPLDLGSLSQFGIQVNSLSSNNISRRLYFANTRSSCINVDPSSIGNTFDNCAGDYIDAQSLQGSSSKFRGIKTTNSTATQSTTNDSPFWDCFTSATSGRFLFCANTPTTGSDIVTSLGAGSGFNGAGSLIMVNVGDSATWTHSYYVLGHTGLQNTTPTITGGGTANFSLDFQYDLGSGFNGTWLAATGANLSGIGAITPTTGIKLKVRATVVTASASNFISFIRLDSTTTSTDQDTLYPFPFDATGTISNLQAGSRVQIYNQTTSTEIVNTTVAGTSYSLSYYNGTGISAGNTVRIRISKLGYLPQTLLAVATSTGFSATANQQTDSIYVANAIDGSTITEFTADYPNIQMDIADPDGVTTVQRIYAWLRYNETTSSGIAQWFNAVTPTDAVNYLIDTTILNMQLDNRNATPVQIIGGRLYRSDNATIIAPLSNSIQMDPFRVYLTDGITTTQATYNNLADTFLRRSTANVEASTFGDALSLRSMYGMVAQGTHNTYVNNNNKLVITKSNETTQLGTRSITNSPNAQPITGLNSD